MGGTKRKIPMEKIQNKESRSVAFSKRREGLFRKASELCVLCNAHIAVLVTPPSANSNVSFYSLGHSSVDDVVHSFLHDRAPTLSHDHVLSRFRTPEKSGRLVSKKPSVSGSGLGFWWEEERFEKTESTEDLGDAIDEISDIMKNVKLRLNNMKDQTPLMAMVMVADEEKLEDFSVQGLDINGGNYGTLEDAVGNLVPQELYQTQRITENSDRFLGGAKMEAIWVSPKKDMEDSVDDDNDAAYLYTDFYCNAPPCLEDPSDFK